MIKSLCVTLCVAGFFISAVVASAAQQDFSADVVAHGRDGSFSGKICMGNGNVRMEATQGITISRQDKKVVWVIMPSEGMYMEQPFDPKDAIAQVAAKSGEAERKSLGPDTVNGKKTEKFQVTYNQGGVRSSVYEWVDHSIEMPVKIAATDKSWSMEYKNIKAGPQDPNLFEVPKGYQKLDLSSLPSGFSMDKKSK